MFVCVGRTRILAQRRQRAGACACFITQRASLCLFSSRAARFFFNVLLRLRLLKTEGNGVFSEAIAMICALLFQKIRLLSLSASHQYSYSSKTSARSTCASSPCSLYHCWSNLSPFSFASSQSMSTSCRGKLPFFFLLGISLREKSLTLYFFFLLLMLIVFLGVAM